MSKMFKVKLVGQRDVLVVSRIQGEGIERVLEDNNVPDDAVIPVGESRMRKSEIKSVIPYNDPEEDAGATRKANDEKYKRMAEESAKTHREFVNLPVQEKAKRMGWFKTCYFALSGMQKAPENLKIEIYNRQMEFYKNNPKRQFCDPKIYKDLIPRPPKTDEKENSLETALVKSAARMIEECLIDDMKRAKYI